MRALLLLAPAALLLPRAARAETSVDVKVDVAVDVHTDDGTPTVVVAEPPPPPPAGPRRLLDGSRWEGSIAIDGGPQQGFAAGDLTGSAVGLDVALGRQLGRVRVAVEYQVQKLWAQRDLYTADGWWDGWEDVGGEVQRWGATARLRGVMEMPRWGDGPGSAFGGYAEAGVGRQTVHFDGGGMAVHRNDVALGLGFELAMGGRRMGGMDVGVRVLASGAPDGTHDLGVLMHLGVLFGI